MNTQPTPKPDETQLPQWAIDCAREAYFAQWNFGGQEINPDTTDLRRIDRMAAIIAKHAPSAPTEQRDAARLSSDSYAQQLIQCRDAHQKFHTALCKIKDSVTADEDFSADDVIEIIESVIGPFAISAEWTGQKVIEELNADLTALRSERDRMAAEREGYLFALNRIAQEAGYADGTLLPPAEFISDLRKEVEFLRHERALMTARGLEAQVTELRWQIYALKQVEIPAITRERDAMEHALRAIDASTDLETARRRANKALSAAMSAPSAPVGKEGA